MGIELQGMWRSLPLGRCFAIVPFRATVLAGRADLFADFDLELVRDRVDVFFMESIQQWQNFIAPSLHAALFQHTLPRYERTGSLDDCAAVHWAKAFLSPRSGLIVFRC